MSLFTPKGDKPQWQKYLDLFQSCDYGDVITFDEIRKAGLDPDRTSSALAKAAAELLDNDSKAIVSVRGRGYRIAHPSEQGGIGRKMHKSAKRKLGRSVAVTTHVDVSQLTSQQQRLVERQSILYAQQLAFMARTEARVSKVEGTVRQVDDRLDVLEATLRHHGIDVPERRLVVGEVEGETPGDPARGDEAPR